MHEWLIAGWVVAGVLYLFGMLATRNTVIALRNSVFQDGSAWEVISGLLALIFWPIAQILATLTVEGPSGRGTGDLDIVSRLEGRCAAPSATGRTRKSWVAG